MTHMNSQVKGTPQILYGKINIANCSGGRRVGVSSGRETRRLVGAVSATGLVASALAASPLAVAQAASGPNSGRAAAPAPTPVCGADSMGGGDYGAGCWNEELDARNTLLRLLALAPAARASCELALNAAPASQS